MSDDDAVMAAEPLKRLVSEELLLHIRCILHTAEENSREQAGSLFSPSNESKREAVIRNHFNNEADEAHEAIVELNEILKGEAAAENQERIQAQNARNEKRQRIYYQDIVYAICNQLDRLRAPGTIGITVCGTWAEPSTQVQDGVKMLVDNVTARRVMSSEGERSL